MSARNRRLYRRAPLVAASILIVLLVSRAIGWGATASPAGSPPPVPSPSPSAAATPSVRIPDDSSVLAFVGDIISWDRDLNLEEQIVEEPEDVLYFSQNRALALRILGVAFDFAKAEAALLDAIGNQTATTQAANLPPRADVMEGYRVKLQGASKAAADQVEKLKAQLAAAPEAQRQALAQQLAGAQGDLQLAQARLDFFKSITKFETGSEAELVHAGLLGRIEELQQSIPQKEAAAPSPAQVVKQAPEPSGLFARAKHLLTLERSQDVLRQRVAATNRLSERVGEFQQALDGLHNQIETRVRELVGQAASGTDTDPKVVKEHKRELDRLLAEHAQVVKAIPPLGAEAAMLRRYTGNLEQWLSAVKHRSVEELRELLARLIGIATVLAIIFAGAFVWRKITFRYVADPHRRHQLLQVRTFVVAFMVALVLLFNFTTELAALATIMGLAAAGVALALQNVILSLAGYFYLTGRFGIRVGDRVELAGVRGDVVQIGLVKLTLMELAGDGGGRQPTGRVVVMPNSVVFQPNASFFKQAPGSNFVWNEVRLGLSPGCDYRLAETRLMEVVTKIFERYRDAVHRQCRAMERQLHVQIEPPAPQSRLRLSQSGIEMVIRYPVEARNAVQIADEVSRRLLDALNLEPGLRLVTLGNTSTIESVVDVPGGPAAEHKREASS
ncbi:MAG: hypothetical protein ABSD31_05455 [Candidatus Binataceae bacterium]